MPPPLRLTLDQAAQGLLGDRPGSGQGERGGSMIAPRMAGVVSGLSYHSRLGEGYQRS
jgi:hypothetical protein